MLTIYCPYCFQVLDVLASTSPEQHISHCRQNGNRLQASLDRQYAAKSSWRGRMIPSKFFRKQVAPSQQRRRPQATQ